MSGILVGQDGASSSHGIIASITYLGMEMGDDLYGFHHGFPHDNPRA